MEKYNLISIEKKNIYLISAEWGDGFKSTIRIADLRQNCPCASCKTTHTEHIEGFELPKVKFGEYTLKKIELAGNMGLKLTWGDKHDSGYYDWELLRAIFEAEPLGEEEIARLMKGAETPKLKKD